ncbi:MAG TPA: hypothetical protein VF608_14605 [Thermoanaerobaculia bacterium]
MSNGPKLMSFEEFRATGEADRPLSEALRQQREHFRDRSAAEALLEPNALRMKGWIPWDDAKITA